jgi:hypothetical protein
LNTNNPLNLDRPQQEQFVFNEIAEDHVFTLTCHKKSDNKDLVRDCSSSIYQSAPAIKEAGMAQPRATISESQTYMPNPGNTLNTTNIPIRTGVGSNQYKTKSLPPIDMLELSINKLELKFKSEVLDDLHRKMAMDQLTDPLLLAEKIKLPMKEIQALCKADLKKVSSFMMLHGVCQFGYDIYVCLRPTQGYVPGEIFFEG